MGDAKRYGTSSPGIGVLNPAGRTNVIRCFSDSEAGSVPADGTTRTILSFTAVMAGAGSGGTNGFLGDYLGTNGAAPQTAAFTTILDGITGRAGSGSNGISNDVDGNKVCPYHEPNPGDVVNGLTLTGSIYKTMNALMIVPGSGVLPGGVSIKSLVNAGGTFNGHTYPARTHPVLFGNIMAGQNFASLSNAAQDAWVLSTVHGDAASIDYFGFDIYAATSGSATAATIAARNSIAIWNHPEVGTSVAVNPPDSGAGSHLAHMQALVGIWQSMAVPPDDVCWYDANHNLMQTKLASAYTSGTALHVNEIPHNQPSGGDSMANGALIAIDPFGVNQRVNLTAAATTTTLSIPALGHTYPLGTLVLLMPLSVDYWNAQTGGGGGGTAFFQSLGVNPTVTPVRKMLVRHNPNQAQTPPSFPYLTDESSTFEGGSVGAWYTTGSPAPVLANTTAQVKDGFRSMQVTLPTLTGNQSGLTGTKLDFVEPAVGTIITVALWVYVPSGGCPPVQFTVDGTSVLSRASSVNNAWQFLSLTFTTTATTNTVDVFTTGSSTAGQVFYVDLVTIHRSMAVLDELVTVAATIRAIEAPVRSLLAGVLARRPAALQAPTRSAVNALEQFQSAHAVSTVTRRAASAVGKVTAAVQGPAPRIAASAAAATLRAAETVAKALGNSTARLQTLTAVQVPARALRAVVAGTRTATATTAGRAAEASGITSTALQSPARRLAAAATSTARAAQAAAPSATQLVENLLQTARAVEATVARAGQVITSSRAAVQAPAKILRAAAGRTSSALQGPAPRASNPTLAQLVRAVQAPARTAGHAVAARLAPAAAHALVRVGHGIVHRLLAAPTRMAGYVTNLFAVGNQTPELLTVAGTAATWSIDVDEPTWSARA